MKSSYDYTTLQFCQCIDYRQRRRRKQQVPPWSKILHFSVVVAVMVVVMMVMVPSVWTTCRNCYNVQGGLVPTYRWNHPMDRTRKSRSRLNVIRDRNIRLHRRRPLYKQSHHNQPSNIRQYDTIADDSILFLFPNDRNNDNNSNDVESNNDAKNQSDRLLLQNMGGIVPFFASQQQPKPSQPSSSEPKEREPSKSGFWGNGSRWFRRDIENATLDQTSFKKKGDVKSIQKGPTSEIKKGIQKKDNIEVQEETTSSFAKLQDIFSFNFTKSDTKKDEFRSGNNKRKKNNGTTNNNPLSVFQKFAAATFFQDVTPEETWYPVFPKTRIMPGELVPVTVAGIDLLVIASIDGRSLYCIANSCPHLGTPLETGKLTRLPIETKTTTSLSLQSDSTSPMTTDFLKLNGKTGSNPNEIIFSETDIANILSQDGCEDCIVCPLHRTAFALTSGEVRGEWCPYPPVIGAMMGTVKAPSSAAVFDVRTNGKNVEVRLNTVLRELS